MGSDHPKPTPILRDYRGEKNSSSYLPLSALGQGIVAQPKKALCQTALVAHDALLIIAESLSCSLAGCALR